MSVQATSSPSQTTFLQRVLQVDGLFSAASGLLLLFEARPIASFMGLNPPMILTMTGAVLILWGLWLLVTTGRGLATPRFVATVIALNLFWVVDSGVILFTDWLPLTTAGWWAIAIVADVVAIFAALQFYGLRQAQR